MILLRIVGAHQLGRLSFRHAADPLPAMPSQSLDEIMAYEGSEDLLDDLLNRYARFSGLSGMQPKVLFADESAFERKAVGRRTTNRSATHIIKAFDASEYPELAANEHVAMRMASRIGIPVAQTRLSANRRLLAVERFDRGPDGTWLGFEDCCVLSGMRASGRYEGSYEQLATMLTRFVSPEHITDSLQQLFSMLVLNCAVGNGDAHLKNFGVLYSHYGAPVRMAPAYDIVSTRVYQPRDVMALSLNGSKQFADRQTLLAFGQRYCLLTPTQCKARLDATCDAVIDGNAELKEMARDDPRFKKACKQLSKSFEQGLDLLR